MLATSLCALALASFGGFQGAPAAPAGQAVDPKQDAKYERELAEDREMGRKYTELYDKEYPPSKNPAAIERVKRIGEGLALIANANRVKSLWGDSRLSNFEYTFKVVQNKDVNAFSLPGGYIYVFDGLVDFCESDDELAGVLAHEISHAAQRHIWTLRREQKKLEKFQLPLILAAIFTGGAALGPLAGGVGIVGTALTSGWSQKAENSADYAAFQYLEKSQFDPTGLLTFMERLRLQEFNQTQGVDLGIYRTHPPSQFRAEKISGYMAEAKVPARRSRVTTTFRTTSRVLLDGTVQLQFGDRPLFVLAGPTAKTRAAAATDRLNDFLDAAPELYEIRTMPNGLITGRNRPLVELHAADAAAAGMSMDKYQAEATRSLRAAAMSIAFHLWEGR